MRSQRLLFAAYADVIHALVPEVTAISIHDASGETLCMTADFLSPDEHALVSEVLLAGSVEGAAAPDARWAEAEAGSLRAGLPVRTLSGRIVGAVLVTLDLRTPAAVGPEPLEQRLASLLTCLAEAIEAAPGGEADEEVEPARTARPIERQPLVASQIREALAAERFELFLQPFRSLQGDLDLPRFEVLLRLRSADGDLLTPVDFMKVAEEARLLPAIDRWVVRTLLSWLMRNRKRWRVPSTFAVNLSGQTIDDPNFVDYVERCLDKSTVPPEALCFEFNAVAASRRSERFAAAGRALARLGCQVAIDDFCGDARTGTQLRNLPAHCVKIDGTLISAAQADTEAQTLITGIIRVANDLGMTTIAESIESDEDLTLSRTLGIDYAQGFLIGRPEALERFDFSVAR